MTNFMQARSDAISRSFPRLKSLGVSQRFFAATENLGLNFGMNVIRPDEFRFVLIKPVQKALPLLGL